MIKTRKYSQLIYGKKKKSSKTIRIKSTLVLRELIYTRVISALEVFFIETIKDIFLSTTLPFMDTRSELSISNAELLSFKSITEIKNKILQKETRPLTSAGFGAIVKYYKKRFNIDLANI